jgi:hypothetical protein
MPADGRGVVMDPYFEKQETKTRRPLISTWAFFWLSIGAIGCAFCWLASVNPEVAIQIGGGLSFMVFVTIVAIVVIIKG